MAVGAQDFGWLLSAFAGAVFAALSGIVGYHYGKRHERIENDRVALRIIHQALVDIQIGRQAREARNPMPSEGIIGQVLLKQFGRGKDAEKLVAKTAWDVRQKKLAPMIAGAVLAAQNNHRNKYGPPEEAVEIIVKELADILGPHIRDEVYVRQGQNPDGSIP